MFIEKRLIYVNVNKVPITMSISITLSPYYVSLRLLWSRRGKPNVMDEERGVGSRGLRKCSVTAIKVGGV